MKATKLRDWPLRASVTMTALSKSLVTMVIETREADKNAYKFSDKKKNKK